MGKGLFFNLPAHGHINPTLPLTRELISRGETIVYITGEKERKKIEPTGAQFYPLPYDLSAFSKSPKSPEIDFLLFDCTLKTLPGLIELAHRESPDYVLHDFACLWGKILAEKLGLPRITIFPNPVLDRPALPPQFIFTLIETLVPLGRRTKKMAQEISRQYQRKPESLVQFLTEDHGPLAVVLTSEIFQPRRDTLGPEIKFAGPTMPDLPEKPDFPFSEIAGKKVIYVSLGTVYGSNKRFFEKCIRAFENTEYCVVISTGNSIQPGDFSRVPSNFIIKHFVPQEDVLKRSALFITHGGMNSIHGALRNRVPMIVAPQGIGSDQHANARVVEKHRAGVALNNPLFRPAFLRETAVRLMADPEIKKGLETLSREFEASNGATNGADEILHFLKRTCLEKRMGSSIRR